MTTTAHNRTLLDAVIYEPVQLAISQPHQALISSASVYLVAAEAAILIEWPWNVLLAIGAEWAYLRGLSSGQSVQTRWAAALNWSAVALVVLYGALWGLRKFGLIPDDPPWWGAVLLTMIHIGCIGAVTLCSAMCHRAALLVEHQKQSATEDAEQARRVRIQQEHDLIELDAARKRQELALWEEGQAAKMRAQNARSNMRRNARPASSNAGEKKCPKCGAELEAAKWLAARRWGHCESCKEPS